MRIARRLDHDHIRTQHNAPMLRLKPQTLSLQTEDLLLLDEARKRQAEERAAKSQPAAVKAPPADAAALKTEKLKEVAQRIGLPARPQ